MRLQLKVLRLGLACVLMVLCAATCATAHAQGAGASGLASVNGTKLYYEAAGGGDGTTVVLIHGGLNDRRLWDEQFHEFARRQRVVRYDLRGYGKSAAATEPFSHVEDLRALLEFLKVERASLVGLSLGGIIAADFALEYPRTVERLVLVGAGLRGNPSPPDREMEAVWQAIQSRDEKKVVAAYLDTSLYAGVRQGRRHARERLTRMLADNLNGLESLRPGFIKYPQPETFHRLGDVRAPTLVVIGSIDSPTLRAIADTLKAKIPGASKVVIEGASHHPPVETPKEFKRALEGFLRASKKAKK